MQATNLINSCENCTHSWKNFQHLTKTELHKVNENRYEATFKPGEIIIKQGSPTSNALFLASGMAKTYIEGINGKNFIISIAFLITLISFIYLFIISHIVYNISSVTSYLIVLLVIIPIDPEAINPFQASPGTVPGDQTLFRVSRINELTGEPLGDDQCPIMDDTIFGGNFVKLVG